MPINRRRDNAKARIARWKARYRQGEQQAFGLSVDLTAYNTLTTVQKDVLLALLAYRPRKRAGAAELPPVSEWAAVAECPLEEVNSAVEVLHQRGIIP